MGFPSESEVFPTEHRSFNRFLRGDSIDLTSIGEPACDSLPPLPDSMAGTFFLPLRTRHPGLQRRMGGAKGQGAQWLDASPCRHRPASLVQWTAVRSSSASPISSNDSKSTTMRPASSGLTSIGHAKTFSDRCLFMSLA